MDFHGIEKLHGTDNWNIWKFAVRNFVRGIDGAYEVCIGEISKPVQLASNATAEQCERYNALYKVWDKADRNACQIIVRTVESKVMALIVACELAQEMWVKLHAIFEQQTKQAAHAVQSEFFGFTMIPGNDIVTHIAGYEGLILRMQQLNVKPDDLSLMVRLLDTLPDSYECLRQSWWPKPEKSQTLKNLIELLTSDEKRRLHRLIKQEELVALIATKAKAKEDNATLKEKESMTYNKRKQVKIKCFACGEVRHIKRKYPKLNKTQTKKQKFTIRFFKTQSVANWLLISVLRFPVTVSNQVKSVLLKW